MQEAGWDSNGQNAVTLPAETFSYVNDTNPFVTNGNGVTSPAIVVADVNGDAIPEKTVSFDNGFAHQTTVNRTVVPTQPVWAYSENSCLQQRQQEYGVRFVDTNADGKADVVTGSWNYTSNSGSVSSAINTYSASGGYSWGGSATGTIPYFDEDGSGSIHGLTTGIFGDVNGDGLPDYEQAVSSMLGDAAYLGNGQLWDAATTSIFSPAKELPVSAPTVTNSQLIDINGDGLADWVYSDSGNTYVLLNTGTAWATSTASHWTIATSTLYLVPSSNPPQYYDRGIRFIDINGDGLPDFVHAFQNSTSTGNPNDEAGTYSVVMLNTGNGWATTTVYGSLSPVTTGSATATGGQCFNEYANWTGNGQNKQDVISTITYPQGGLSNISYTKSAQGNNANLPITLLAVSSIVTNDGFGNTAEKDYTYSGGKMYTALGVRDQKFAGFANSTETDAQTKTTTYYDQGDTIDTSSGEQNDGYGQIGHPFRIDTTNVSGSTLLRQVFDRWDTATTSGGNVTFVYLARQLQNDYAGDGSHRDTAIDYAYDRTTGNLTQITRCGEVNGNSVGTFSDIGSDKSVETLSYVGQGAGTSVGSSTTQTFSTTTTWTAPAGITSVTVDMWGGGGGGSGGSTAQVGGGAGAYVHSTNVPVTPGHIYTITVGTGGGGGIGSGAVGAGGTGYTNGGNGSSDTNGRGGGGGGSSAFTNDATTLIAAGGGGAGYNIGNGASGSSGGAGGNGAGSPGSGRDFAGGGGAASTAGASASGATGGAGGTGATAQTGTNGNGCDGGGSSAGSSGNGNSAGSGPNCNNGGAGSGRAAHGTAGSGTDSGGGGNGMLSGNGENGGAPGAGGGGTGGASLTAGSGGPGEVVLTYGTSTGSTGSSTSQTIASTTTWTAPTGVSSVTIDLWGGGGGSGGGSAQVGGGAGAYVHASNVPVTLNSTYTVTIAAGGGGGVGNGAAGVGGTGYANGGGGSSDSNGRGGGGGGSSAFANDGPIIIAAGGGGAGWNIGNAASSSSGGAGGSGSGGAGNSFAGGGGAAGSNGASASGITGGAAGTGATTQTGTNGNGCNGGGSSAGSSGNGHNGGCDGTTGALGSGGAAHGTAGTSTDSGGGGNAILSGNAENGGAPGAGGTGGASATAGSGGAGKLIVTYVANGSATTT